MTSFSDDSATGGGVETPTSVGDAEGLIEGAKVSTTVVGATDGAIEGAAVDGETEGALDAVGAAVIGAKVADGTLGALGLPGEEAGLSSLVVSPGFCILMDMLMKSISENMNWRHSLLSREILSVRASRHLHCIEERSVLHVFREILVSSTILTDTDESKMGGSQQRGGGEQGKLHDGSFCVMVP